MTAPVLSQAEAAWALAPLLAARRSVRLWSPGVGFDDARPLGRRLPERPAAIPIFDKRGRTTLLALDFDPKGYGREQVVRDADQAAAWIQAAEGRVIVDESTRGGRHVLVPLAAGVDFAVRHLRPVLEELARRLPTLDIIPMVNLATGCITAPGSPCKEGGHRRLLTPLDEAIDAATTRSAPGTIARLAALLDLSSLPATASASTPPADTALGDPDDDTTAVDGEVMDLPPVALEFAVHGVLPDRRNRKGEPWTRHEARQSVLAHAAVRGMNLSGVLAKLVSGEWPGMRAAYDRYGPRWERALRADWKKALTWANDAAPKFRLSAHEEVHTGGQRSLREWLARAERWTLLCSLLDGQTRWTTLALWQALAYAAQLTGAPTIAQGRRWLSIAAGLLADETVSSALRVLRELPGSPILLVEKGVGPLADRYALVTPRINDEDVPADPAVVARTAVEPVHPAWAVIGLAARRVFEVLDRVCPAGQGSVRPLDLPELTGMSTSQVYEALIRLAEFDLVERGHGWVRRTTRTLTDVAADHAVDELRAARLERHRAERREWHALLAMWNGEAAVDCPEIEKVPADPWRPDEREDYLAAVMATGPPPADHLPDEPGFDAAQIEQDAINLLIDVLGARVLERHAPPLLAALR
ncbi:hypothetical protein [Actinokineospora enzanensis]|uniref:hypothetical protein n=1 Tax=Actinokineospora enzanensis TaxID=155975 RepID=UPI00036A07DB|nr:hypothetical protein [Actinokineospora enzanensis]